MRVFDASLTSKSATASELKSARPMTSNMAARLVKAVGGSLVLLSVAAPAWCQERSGFAKEGPYVGVSTQPVFTLDGVTFDGQTYYKEIDGDEIIILPKLDRKNMVRPVGGFRSKWGAFELSYDQTKHAGTFAGIPASRRPSTRSTATNASSSCRAAASSRTCCSAGRSRG
jgi:hypothetical protein